MQNGIKQQPHQPPKQRQQTQPSQAKTPLDCSIWEIPFMIFKIIILTKEYYLVITVRASAKRRLISKLRIDNNTRLLDCRHWRGRSRCWRISWLLGNNWLLRNNWLFRDNGRWWDVGIRWRWHRIRVCLSLFIHWLCFMIFIESAHSEKIIWCRISDAWRITPDISLHIKLKSE